MYRRSSTSLHSSAVPARAAGWLAALAAFVLGVLAVPVLAQTSESLGAGDTVRITVFQNPDLTTETRVSERGTVQFPLVGEVKVGGDTPAGAANRIADGLKKGNFMKNPQVTVALLQV